MTFRAYLDLPEEMRAEYVDGCALVNPPPTPAHQRICRRLLRQLQPAATSPTEVVAGAGWVVRGAELVRIPDVMVLAVAPARDLVTDTPLVVVDVLDASHHDDLVRKACQYLAAGVAQFWVLDPAVPVLDVFANQPGGWSPVAHLTDVHPGATVDVPGVGAIVLSLADLLG
jgi:Uma2 family endonuclease